MLASDISFRKPIISDIDELVILAEGYCKEFNLSYDLETIKFHIFSLVTSVPSILAVTKNKIVGAISYMVVPEQWEAQVLAGKKLLIFVDPEYRGNGIAKELLQKAEEHCREYGAKKFYYTSKKAPTEEYLLLEIQYVKEL